MLAGLAGALLPIPGPPLSFAGLIALHCSRYGNFDTTTLVLYGVATLALVVLDYVVPAWGTKTFGGTNRGAMGATIGLVVGIFFTPVGMFLGAFIGAFLGEISNQMPTNQALKAAIGSCLGILIGTVMKVAYCLLLIFIFCKELMNNI
jgi:uncharacterized protein YqgC (DUF456 family)